MNIISGLISRVLTLTLLLAALPAKVYSGADQKLLKSTPSTVMKNEIITLEPIAGHHFNYEAPHQCPSEGFIEKKPLKATCQLSEAGSKTIKIGVCDDPKSFCKIESFEVMVLGNEGGFWEKIKRWFIKAEVSGLEVEKQKFEGWIVNDWKTAQSVARKTSKPLFIDFTAIWCPPCNELEDFVFNQKSFMKATEGMVRLKLDADFPDSNIWKNHFKVGGYPTVVAADAELNEIGRKVGFYPLEKMNLWVEKMMELRREPVTLAEKTARANWGAESKRRIRVGRWYLNRKEFEKAMEFFSELPSARKDYLEARFNKAKLENSRNVMKSTLIQLVDEFDDFEIADWNLKLMTLDPVSGKKRLNKSLVAVEKSLREGDFSTKGWKRSDLFVLKAKLFEKLKNPEAAKSAYLQCANENINWIDKSKTGQGIRRGMGMDHGWCLMEAGESEKSLEVYKKLLAAYPTEFTFNYYIGHILKDLGQKEQALQHAIKAHESSYGDNRLRATHLKASLEIDLNRKMEAKNTLYRALTNTKLPKEIHVRTHRYYSRLKQLYDKNFRI